MENTFSWLVLPNSSIILMYEKVLSLVIFAFLLFKFRSLMLDEQVYLGLMFFVVIKLIFESMLDYGTIFQQLTLFTILFPVAFIVFIKAISRTLDLDVLEIVAQFYIVLYVVFMAVYGRDFSFSLEAVTMDDYGPFSGDSRIIHARSIFMLIIPLLWYFNQFLVKGKKTSLLLFVFCIIAIVIHQHRSVWASSLFGMGIYLFMALRNGIISIPKVTRISLVAIIVLGLTTFVISNISPGLIDFFGERFSEILDPAREDGTGKFRADQRRVYFPMVLEKPVFGLTFEGFEMKNPLVDWWPAKSGQHFHEGYMEMLFYHGFFGLLLKYFYLLYLAVYAFSKKLSEKAIILIAFSLAGLIFSFSYVLPLVFWGNVGLCLYYLSKCREDKYSENRAKRPINIDIQQHQKYLTD
ncbi:O-antigen ligase family protein [Pedobacter sp. MC2016-05]|uniref:O-antigen ligase family protein n=1 Tax=Pedobacter sp. MC2016-05 TaxID=2994474 RepID=UPI002245CD56|nr:O-antigen ligase family protein [Pedobacter sp. MC2016-05]MCX2473261.1 O-antigen ligase family protein [Pedobacter sp. MC2016-05]